MEELKRKKPKHRIVRDSDSGYYGYSKRVMSKIAKKIQHA